MANYTAELWKIIDAHYDIFDFIYSRTPESQAIVSDEQLEQGFIDHYYLDEIGFETVERFMQRLKVRWKESLGEFDALLVAYAEPINVKTTSAGESTNTNIVNETPMNALDYGAESNHASQIVHNKGNSKGYAGMTEIELLEKYHDKLKDIQTEFYEQFEDLFMTIF